MTNDLEHISQPLDAIMQKLETAVNDTSRDYAIKCADQYAANLKDKLLVRSYTAKNLADYTADPKLRTYYDFTDFEREAELYQKDAARIGAVERIADDLRDNAWAKYWSRT